MADGSKVRIDRDGCISCGVCWTACPDFFEENPDDNRSQVVPAHRANDNPAEGTAPANLQSCVQEAADGCPVSVIAVE